MFGEYDELRPIGVTPVAEFSSARGPHGRVVLARLDPELCADDGFREAFATDAVAAAKTLWHPNIARVTEVGASDLQLYLAFDLAGAAWLPLLVARAKEKSLWPLPPALAVQLAMPMLAALHAAHLAGFLHRDVSADAVWVTREGEVKLTGFGLGRARPRPATFVAPEQSRGKPPDARADVFTAALVLYQLVCGRLPVAREADLFAQIATGELDPAKTANPSLDAELAALIDRGLSFDREQRYPTAEIFCEALANWWKAQPAFGSLQSTVAHLLGESEELPEFAARAGAYARERPPEPAREREGAKVDVVERAVAAIGGPAEPGVVPQLAPSAPTTGRFEIPSRSRQRGWRSWSVVAALGVAATVGVVRFWPEPPQFYDLTVTSKPPGAQVFIDQRHINGVTPLVVSPLKDGEPHVVRMVLPRRLPWTGTVDGHQRDVYAELPEPKKP